MLQGEASLLTLQRTAEAEEMEGHYGAQVALCYQCKRCTSGCPLADVQEGALPVLYFTQLMGVAFGLSPRALGLDKHFRDPAAALRSHSLVT